MAQIEEFQELVLSALDVVKFKLIRTKGDLGNNDDSFSPLMAHQIFGSEESIFGYKNLHVRILYTAGPLQIYIGIEYDSKVDDMTNGDIRADNVVATIAEKLPYGCYFMNLDEFCKTLDKAEKFLPFGEKLTEFTYRSEEGKERLFEIYYCDHKISAFLKFFGRLQTFVLWFIDAASYIDVDDPQWNYFVCYEKYKNDNGDYQHATVGYTTVYEYYAYPQNVRPRISQMLVLPVFQKKGIGTKFLHTIYKYYQGQKNVIDITVEDPSDDFRHIRNYVDASLCIKLKSFSRENVKIGFNKEMIREAQEIVKINPRQCRYVYEIIRLYYTSVHDPEEFQAYRLTVKNRLNAVYYKQENDLKKMEKAKVDTQWMRQRLPTRAQRFKQLQTEFEEVLQEYEKIVEKLRT